MELWFYLLPNRLYWQTIIGDFIRFFSVMSQCAPRYLEQHLIKPDCSLSVQSDGFIDSSSMSYCGLPQTVWSFVILSGYLLGLLVLHLYSLHWGCG